MLRATLIALVLVWAVLFAAAVLALTTGIATTDQVGRGLSELLLDPFLDDSPR